MLCLTTIKAATSETVLDEPPELLINFVQKIQQEDASTYVDRKEANTASYERDLQGLLQYYGRVVVPKLVALR